MPGNYTETKRIDLEFARIDWYTSVSVNWIYNISALPWQNCVGNNLIGVAFKSRSIALEPRLLLEIHGCRNNTCEQLVLSDLLVDAFTAKVEYEYAGKAEYTLNETILDYEYFNITLTPLGLIVEEFLMLSSVTCSFQYEVSAPLLTIKGHVPKTYTITIPISIDTTWLRLGIALSMLGIMIIVIALTLAYLFRLR